LDWLDLFCPRFFRILRTKNLTADFFYFSHRPVSFKLWVSHPIGFLPNVNQFFNRPFLVSTTKGRKE
jgi:hypothetical protein